MRSSQLLPYFPQLSGIVIICSLEGCVSKVMYVYHECNFFACGFIHICYYVFNNMLLLLLCMHMYSDQRTTLWSLFLLLVLGIKLRLPGLHGKHFTHQAISMSWPLKLYVSSPPDKCGVRFKYHLDCLKTPNTMLVLVNVDGCYPLAHSSVSSFLPYLSG